jgi:hypothetical protein
VRPAGGIREGAAEMTSRSGNGERLKGSQLGYRGKGVPDSETIYKLQERYSAAVEGGGLPPETWSKLKRMRALAAKAERGEKNNLSEEEIVKLWEEVEKLLLELMPILHFKVDDVDWDN